MKKLCFILLLLGQVCYGQMAFIPSNESLETYIKNIENQYPNIVQVKSLGKTTHTPSKDIWAIKISDNVTQTEDEPVWVFTGIIHGGEKLGIRVMINLINDLTSQYNSNSKVKNWVDNYEIWIIPNMNPYGTDARNSGLRKNGWNADGGVDLNRNWGFRHEYGGSSDVTSSSYRGPFSFSENETQFVRDLYLNRKPLFGCTFHRGNEDDGGQILRPWHNSPVGSPPDFETISDYASLFQNWVWTARQSGGLCEEISSGVFKLQDPLGVNCTSGTGGTNKFCKQLCWAPTILNMSAYGQSSNWCHSAVGTHDFSVEICDQDFKKDFMFIEGGSPSNSTETAYLNIATEIAQNWTDGIKEWLDYFIFDAQNIQFRGPGITGHVTDGDGHPVEAKVTVVGRESNYTEDRYSDAKFGRFWRLLPAGNYTVTFEKAGCSTVTKQVLVNGNGALTNVDAVLCPLATNIETTFDKQFRVYPNPSQNGLIEIDIPNDKLSYYKLLIYNNQGQVIEELITLKTHLKLDLSNLSKGLYNVKVISEDGWIKTDKIVLK